MNHPSFHFAQVCFLHLTSIPGVCQMTKMSTLTGNVKTGLFIVFLMSAVIHLGKNLSVALLKLLQAQLHSGWTAKPTPSLASWATSFFFDNLNPVTANKRSKWGCEQKATNQMVPGLAGWLQAQPAAWNVGYWPVCAAKGRIETTGGREFHQQTASRPGLGARGSEWGSEPWATGSRECGSGHGGSFRRGRAAASRGRGISPPAWCTASPPGSTRQQTCPNSPSPWQTGFPGWHRRGSHACPSARPGHPLTAPQHPPDLPAAAWSWKTTISLCCRLVLNFTVSSTLICYGIMYSN